MSTLTSADIVTKRSSTQVTQAPGGRSTFSLSYDEPVKPEVVAKKVEGEEEEEEEGDKKDDEEEAAQPPKIENITQTSFKANQQRGTSSSIFNNDPSLASAPVTARSSKTQQSSIDFGNTAAPAPTSTRSNKTSQSSIDFGASESQSIKSSSSSSKTNKNGASTIVLGGAEAPKVSPRITPTNQSQVFGNSAPAPVVPSPKTSNKSLMSTINLTTETDTAAPTSAKSSRQAPGGRTSIVIG